jgi:choline dehydrogenase-like flavoprotein
MAERFRSSHTAHLMVGSTVVELSNAGETSRVDRAMVVTLAKRHLEIRAQVFVLATGGIENARLLLLSRLGNPNGLGNHHDLVGRFFQEHLRVQTGLIIPADAQLIRQLGFYQRRFVGPWQVTSSLTLDDLLLRQEGLLNFAAYLRVTNEAAASAPARAAAALIQARRDLKTPLRPYVFAAVRHPLQVARARIPIRGLAGEPRVQLSFQSEQAPNPNSRVILGNDTDALGRPRARVEWRLADSDTDSIRRAQELIHAEIHRSNLGSMTQLYGEEKIPIPIRGFRHHIGTTRMHLSPRSGVVDSECRVHGINNLYVAGSSIFPTGGYANPTLTLVALSLRLADHIRKIMTSPVAV